MSESVIHIDLNRFNIDAQAVLVIDSTERGIPAKGGIRVHSNVTTEEIAALSGEMSKKCILADLPFGGAKGGIRLSNLSLLEEAMYAFGRELSKMEILPYKWCAAPDVNTDSKAIDAFVAGCASVKGWRKARLAATGKSTGIPHELGSTAYGLVLSTKETISNLQMNLDLKSASAIVEGTGEVGGNAIGLLIDKGTQILGVSDVTGFLYGEGGFDGRKLKRLISERATVKDMAAEFTSAQFGEKPAGLLDKKADMLVLAGPGRSLNPETCRALNVRLICEGANIAYTSPELRDFVNSRAIFSIPGIIANSGGVISSYMEWLLENENLINMQMDKKWDRVKDAIDSKIKRNIKELCARAQKDKATNSYDHAIKMAEERLKKANAENVQLEAKTKEVNKRLEEKFKVYTK